MRKREHGRGERRKQKSTYLDKKRMQWVRIKHKLSCYTDAQLKSWKAVSKRPKRKTRRWVENKKAAVWTS